MKIDVSRWHHWMWGFGRQKFSDGLWEIVVHLGLISIHLEGGTR